MVKAMLYRMRVGCPWKDPPAGRSKSFELAYQKFNRWSTKKQIGQNV